MKDKIDIRSVETFDIGMKLIAEGYSDFTLENPRDEETLEAAADALYEILEEHVDGEQLYDLEEDFTSSKSIGVTHVIADTYEIGQDITFALYKINTEDYIHYRMDYAIFFGQPMKALEMAFGCVFE